MIISQSINNTRKEYPDARELEKKGHFLTLKEYENIAKKLIKKYIKRFGGIINAKYLIESQELLSEVMYIIMKGDWGWDETKSNKMYYRSKNAQWAIGDIVHRHINSKGDDILISQSAFVDDNDKNMLEMMISDDSTAGTIKELEEEEEKEKSLNKIKTLMPKVLTDMEQKCVTMYYLEGKDVTSISKKLSKTPQRIHQLINNSIKTLKEFI